MKNDKKSFWALIATQFFGAFNDNIFKVVVALLVIRWVEDPVVENNWKTVSLLVFGAPFILFSLAAGRMADRWSKAKIMLATKVFEILVVAMAIFAMMSQNIPLMMSGLFLLALQSAFFGPSKYGILPELMGEKDLSVANGLLNAFTFISILIGTILGTFIIDNVPLIAAIMAVATIGGVIGSLLIARVPAANPTQPLEWNPITDFRRNWQLIHDNVVLKRSLIAVSYFWFVGAVLQINTLTFVEEILQASTKASGVLLLGIVIGVSLGSLAAGKLSRQKVELGLVPIGAIGISIFTIALFFSQESFTTVLVNAMLLGFSSGLFVIPLNTLIQLRSPQAERGRILATANFLSFVAIVGAGLFIGFFGSVLKLNSAQVFLALGVLSIAVTIFICMMIPQAPLRLVLYLFTNTIYRIRVVGQENVPMHGPALLVPNHVSLADPFLVSASLSRLIRFVMFRGLYEKRFIHPLVKTMEAIPISEEDNPKEIMRSLLQARKKLEEGHLVCIFAEGQISRLGGVTLGFKRGLDVILKGMDVPVIPVHLEGVWGSIFSFQNKKFIWKWPRKIPYPVTVTFGAPLKKTDPASIRQAVMDMGAEAFRTHRQQEPTLFESFLSQAKSAPRQKVVADSTGKEMTYQELLTSAYLIGKRLPKQEAIGVLLPPTVGAAVANLAIASRGSIPINLNYTLSREAVDQICARAKISTIITSPKMLEKLGWTKTDNMIEIESLGGGISGGEKISGYLLTRFLPAFILRKTLFRRASGNLNDLATIMFTSGSTGIPKGVELTQANILSNIQSITMILQLGKEDVLLGVLPFFHSFGYTASLWYPLLAGFKAVYHHNPLDSKTIGELCRKERVSFLMGTPTFLSAYIRRIEREDFSSLRFAVAGAEKLRPELAKAFEEKYGVPILEGYGCTELSPVVALNVPDIMDGEIFQVGRKVGKIGRAIPGVSVKIVDPDTFVPQETGKPGLLLVKGPNVMKGYLDDPEKTAEAIKEGWYVTGDIATIDEDGFIQITDRLSRFSKIGGEMVPHILVEQKLHELANSMDRIFAVTSVPDDKKGEALAVLVAGYSGNLDQLWKDLNSTDMPKLWVPARDKFIVVDAIPVLGSGKVDMQQVKSLANAKINSGENK